MMPLDDLLEKTEEELHDEIVNLGKISVDKHRKRIK